jgi:dihydrofolate synthase/folylpolyglutamate synthase
MIELQNHINRFFSELEIFGIKLGLEQTKLLFSKMGSPEKRLKFIHLAGTNGKGSVGAMLSAALSGVGFKTAFYSSPHLIDIRERFRIDGKAISISELAEEISLIEPHICEMRKNDMQPTYFEVTTAVAAAYFAKNSVDFVIWECGMGGRFDATNIVMPELSIITGIALDHTAHLGSSIEKITFEKAGIIKHNRPIFCGELPEEAKKVIAETGASKNSECYFMEQDKPEQGGNFNYQQKNAKLAESVIQYLSEKFHFNSDKAVTNMANAKWPGRMQILKNGTIIDGAHNPQAAEALVRSLTQLYPGRKYSIIFASLQDKESIKVVKILARIAEEFIFPEFRCSRGAVENHKLKVSAASIGIVNVKTVSSLKDALAFSGKNTLITGSLYLAGEALRELSCEKEVFNIY